jgi:hypothetical protein
MPGMRPPPINIVSLGTTRAKVFQARLQLEALKSRPQTSEALLSKSRAQILESVKLLAMWRRLFVGRHGVYFGRCRRLERRHRVRPVTCRPVGTPRHRAPQRLAP